MSLLTTWPRPATRVEPLTLAPLSGAPRHYQWGSPTAIPQLTGMPVTGEPVAELWLGAHPDAPATVHTSAGPVPLDAVLARDPNLAGGPGLPFLLKVLAADRVLSLQVHPTAEQAAAGWSREQAAGLPRTHPERAYPDRTAKPEMLVALTPFRALAGIRDPRRTADLLEALHIPQLAWLLDTLHRQPAVEAVTAVLTRLLTSPETETRAMVDAVAAAAAAVSAAPGTDVARAADLAVRLCADHPADAGVVAALLLNDVTLNPGQALYVPSRIPHAYVHGLGVEVMTCSNNVLRAGLTRKPVNVPELLAVLDPTPGPAPVVNPSPLPAGDRATWLTGDPAFALTRVSVTGSHQISAAGPRVLLATDGYVEVRAGDAAVALRAGAAAFLAAGVPAAVTGAGTLLCAGEGSTQPA